MSKKEPLNIERIKHIRNSKEVRSKMIAKVKVFVAGDKYEFEETINKFIKNKTIVNVSYAISTGNHRALVTYIEEI